MRTEDQLRAAFEAFLWYVDGPDGKGGRVHRQNFATQMNVMGGLAMLEWVLGREQEGNPIAGTLKDIAVMRQKPEQN